MVIMIKCFCDSCFAECAQDLWTSFKKHILRLFRKEVEEDSPSDKDSETGIGKIDDNVLIILYFGGGGGGAVGFF